MVMLSVNPERMIFPGLLFTCHAVELTFVSTIDALVVLFLSKMLPLQFGALLNEMETVFPGAPPVVAPNCEICPRIHGDENGAIMPPPPEVAVAFPVAVPVCPSRSLKLAGNADFPASAITHA